MMFWNLDGKLTIYFPWFIDFALQEFVNEKIQRQQLENEQERLTSELEKLGLDREKLLHQELNQDET